VEHELPLATPDDWGTLRKRGLTTVVDPMIYRAGELFCAGYRQAPHPIQTWSALSANLAGLSAFFDAIVYNDQLPIFDYGITFPEAEIVGAGTGYRLVPGVNVNDEILVPIRVHEPVYAPVKEAALAELRDRPAIGAELRSSMLSEMTAFRYAWEPTLTGTENEDPDERRLSILLFGGLLFSGYAQELRGLHLLQPKRGKLFGEVAFGTAADDAALYARLASLPEAAPDAVSNALELPRLPSFLPYLIDQKPRTPGELLRLALAQRTDRDVLAYRRWRQELSDDLARGGNALQKRAELDTIRSKLNERFTASGVDLKVSVETVALAVPVPKLEVAKSTQIRPREAWGWCVRKIRGDHRKILTRLIGAQHAFSRLDLALKEIWHTI
jgi:hypothetical protein